MDNQKQSPSVIRNRCSENMQHVYRRTPMPKCDFNREIALRHGCSPENFLFSEGMQAIYRRKPMPKSHFFIEITFWHGCSPVNLLYIFGTPFPKKTFGKLLLDNFAEAACGFNTDFSNSSLWIWIEPAAFTKTWLRARCFNPPCFQNPKLNMKPFAKIANDWEPLTIFAKVLILNVWQGSEFASAK